LKKEKRKKKRSQYDELLSLQHLQEIENSTNDEKMYSLLKSFIDTPLNSFVSIYGSVKPQFPSSDPVKDQKRSFPNYVSEMLKSPPKKESILKSSYSQKPTNILHRVDVNMRTRHLIKSIQRSSTDELRDKNIISLKDHLLHFPSTRITAFKQDAIGELLNLKDTVDAENTRKALKMTLAMLGHVDVPKDRGLRILSLDGGGCRGAVSVEILEQLTKLCGEPVHKLFDYICGVSTGALLTFLLAIKKYEISEIVPLYRNFGSKIFQRSRLGGMGNLFMTHAYYNTDNYNQILKQILGDELLIQSTTEDHTPKCSSVSALVNRINAKPFIWRNYSIVPGTRYSHWPGTCRAALWEAARASSAAPGYFEEFIRGGDIHQDGAMFSNNPTGIALNQSKLLWPTVPIQCVVSVGSGRYEPSVGPTVDQLTLREKFMKVVDGATNVSGVHSLVYDLLPRGRYYRFDPYIKEPLMIDDYEPYKLDMLVEDARNYIETNELKFMACANCLMEKIDEKN